MYHYVRELKYSRYPKIKGLDASSFKEQIAYFEQHYQFVTAEECIYAVHSNYQLPKNAILLTFDDGYIDHFHTVFPILEAKGIQGLFFPPAKAIMNHEVLDVNKIHYLLASEPKVPVLIQEIYNCLDNYRSEYSLKSNEYFYSKNALYDRYDSKDIVFIKRLLQFGLEEKLRHQIVDTLFRKYVTSDIEAFSRELYMDAEQLNCMSRNGMVIGSHGYDHNWLNKLPSKKQEKEIDRSLDFLEQIGSPIDSWIMCYPYGAYDDSLINLLRKKKCKLAFTTKVNIARLNRKNMFTLERLDTNDFPTAKNARPNNWTKNISNIAAVY